jgi:uncharacterized membrane protein
MRLAILSLLVLAAAILAPRPGIVAITITLPVAALLITALRPPRRWGGWVAVCMVPYVCVAIGEAIANPAGRARGTIIATSAVFAFFAAMDYVRRTGTSLRN